MKTTKDILNQQWEQFDAQSFLKNDPLQVVKSMIEKKPNSIGDIEICAILTATIAWGQREQIIKTANSIMEYCNWQPLEFIKYGDFYDIPDEQNIYRTLKGKAFKEMCHKMRLFYNKYDSIQNTIIQKKASVGDLIDLLSNWGESARLGSPSRNSA
jgi:putative heme iron utilization protein